MHSVCCCLGSVVVYSCSVVLVGFSVPVAAIHHPFEVDNLNRNDVS